MAPHILGVRLARPVHSYSLNGSFTSLFGAMSRTRQICGTNDYVFAPQLYWVSLIVGVLFLGTAPHFGVLQFPSLMPHVGCFRGPGSKAGKREVWNEASGSLLSCSLLSCSIHLVGCDQGYKGTIARSTQQVLCDKTSSHEHRTQKATVE